jgi:hypothetical protein
MRVIRVPRRATTRRARETVRTNAREVIKTWANRRGDDA